MKTAATAVVLFGAALARAQSAGPSMEHTPIVQATAGQPLTISATIHSANGVFQPVVLFRHPGEATWRKQELLAGANGVYAMTLPGSAVDGDLEYYLEAYDNDGNGPARAGSPESPFRIVVPVASTAQPAPAAAVTAPPENAAGAGWIKPAGWAGLSVGGAGLVVGTILMVVAGNEAAAAQADPTAGGAFHKSQTAASENTAGIVTLVAGSAVAIAGAVLLLLPHGHHAEAGSD